jgi:Zinc dependent phospholipase C
MRIRKYAAIAAGLCCLVSSPAQAFKTKTHIVIANEVMEGLARDEFGGLVALPEDYQDEVKQALLDHPGAFRAGTLGPDHFPDMIAGQLFVHTNHGTMGDGALDNSEPFEARTVEKWRSIDYGMFLLRSAYEFQGDAVERSKAIAFAYGYLGHMIGDAFAHSTVNEWAGGAWGLENGQGTFGILTEEIKHLTVEALIDDMLPQSPQEDLVIEVPREFLHQILTEPVMDGPVEVGPAGAFGGDYYKALVAVRDKLQDLADHDNWTDDDFLSFGLDAFALQNEILTFGTNVGDPIADVEFFFQQRALLFNAVLERWVWLNECLAQNYVWATNLESGGLPRVQAGPLTVDACDAIDFEPEFELGDIGTLYGGELNTAARGELGELGTMDDSVKRMGKFLEVAILELVTFEPERDIGSLNTVVNAIGPCAQLIEWDSCENACEEMEAACTTAGDVAACVLCGLSGDPVACLECVGVYTPFCDVAVQAGSAGACTLCDESPFCGAFQQMQELQGLLDVSLDTLVEQVVAPIRDQIIEDIAEEVFGEYYESVADAAELYEMRRTKGGSVWLTNFVYLPEDLRAGGRSWLDELFVSGMNVAKAVIAPTVTPAELADATWPSASPRLPNATKADYDELIGYLWDAAHGVVPPALVDGETPWLDGLAPPEAIQKGVAGKLVRVLDALGLLLERPGPTARVLLGQLSATTVDPNDIDALEADLYAFSPTHNAMALTWRSLLNVPSHLTEQFTSDICNTTSNIACDGIASLDDPNHHLTGDVAIPAIAAGSQFDTASSTFLGSGTDADRSYYAWSPQEIVWKPGHIGPETPCSIGRTNFVATHTTSSMLGDYLSVYQGPENCEFTPGFASIDSALDVGEWEPTPNGTTSFIDDGHGGGSMEVCGQGFVTLTSPAFDTTDWPQFSHQLAFDVKIPSSPPNPHWWGSARIQVNIPSAGLNNVWIGEKHLTGAVTPGQWNTLIFDVPHNVYQAIAGDHPNAQFFVSLNGLTTGQCWAIDDLRFVGTTEFREEFHTPDPGSNPLATNGLFSFENQGDWSAPNAVTRRVTELTTHGAAAFGIVANGYKLITSRPFSTSELQTVGTEMGLDLYIPNPQPNPYWVGQVQLFVTCPTANIYNQFLGQQELTHLFRQEFNTLSFPLSPAIRSALLGNHHNCQISIAINVNNGSGEFILDRLGFGGALTQRN